MRTDLQTASVDSAAWEYSSFKPVMKRSVVPYCTSFRCTRKPVDATGVLKVASRFAVDCQDCGHVLVWRAPDDKTTGWN